MNAQPKENWYNPEATTFGDRLSGAREEAGMDQEELARRLGVKLKTLCNWEDDLAEPRANKLSMMAGMLNVSLLWLLTGEGEGPEGPDGPQPGALSGDVADILAEIRQTQAQIAAAAQNLSHLERQLTQALKIEAGE